MSGNDQNTRDRSQPEATAIELRVHPLTRLFLWGVAIFLFVRFLETVSFVVLLLLAAAAMASLLAPLRSWFPGPRWIGGSIVGILSAGLLALGIGLVGWLLSKPVRAEAAQWSALRESVNQRLQTWTTNLGFTTTITVEDAGRQILVWLTGSGDDFLKQVFSGTGAMLVAFATFVFGFIYLLSENNRVIVRAMEDLLPRRREAVGNSIQHLSYRLRWWTIGAMMSMVMTGTLTGLGFWLIGLKSAATFAVLAGISEIVPMFGPAMVFLLSLLVAATDGSGQVIGVAVTYLVVQAVESYIIYPLVMRKAVHIPPLITLFTIVLWGRLFGAVGLVMAIPLNLTIWTAVEHFYLKRSQTD